ncbi:MAG: kinase [Novosphingobium sp.]|nr:kinase [Novosphingobium sp.]
MSRRPVVLGICGAQGSGKSTLARALLKRCEALGIVAACLSIDDLYLTKAEREHLARDVHPLLLTRGPPGTHDPALGLSVIDCFERGRQVALPRFDKASDDRAPKGDWPIVSGQCEVLILEGWCVGARPEKESALVAPVNALECDEDPGGIWRSYVNRALAGRYQDLFARIDALVLLESPGFDIVLEWRMQQEDELRARYARGSAVMKRGDIARFVQHYERITRHVLREMPGRADLVIRLARDRSPLDITRRV